MSRNHHPAGGSLAVAVRLMAARMANSHQKVAEARSETAASFYQRRWHRQAMALIRLTAALTREETR